jgi:hypothetical protein
MGTLKAVAAAGRDIQRRQPVIIGSNINKRSFRNFHAFAINKNTKSDTVVDVSCCVVRSGHENLSGMVISFSSSSF